MYKPGRAAYLYILSVYPLHTLADLCRLVYVLCISAHLYIRLPCLVVHPIHRPMLSTCLSSTHMYFHVLSAHLLCVLVIYGYPLPPPLSPMCACTVWRALLISILFRPYAHLCM